MGLNGCRPPRWIGHVTVDSAVRFVDVDDPATHTAVDVTLRRALREYGVKRIDRGAFLSSDRRVTRTIASRYHWLAQTPDRRTSGASDVSRRLELQRADSDSLSEEVSWVDELCEDHGAS